MIFDVLALFSIIFLRFDIHIPTKSAFRGQRMRAVSRSAFDGFFGGGGGGGGFGFDPADFGFGSGGAWASLAESRTDASLAESGTPGTSRTSTDR